MTISLYCAVTGVNYRGSHGVIVCHVQPHRVCVDVLAPERCRHISPCCGLRAPRMTAIPCLPSWRATSKPIPLFAPVMNAIFLPFREGTMLSSFPPSSAGRPPASQQVFAVVQASPTAAKS